MSCSKFNRIYFIAFVFLSSCFKAGVHEPQGDQASFHLTEVRGRMNDSDSLAGWGIPSSKTFVFTTCAFDRRTNQPLQGREFAIQRSDGTQTTVKAKTDGCFSWIEKFKINIFSDAKAVHIRRLIHAEGLITGSRQADLAIFPWACETCSGPNGARVIDLSEGVEGDLDHSSAIAPEQMIEEDAAYKQRPDGKYLDTSSGSNSAAPSLPEDLSFAIAPRTGVGDGGEFSIGVSCTVKVLVKNLLQQTDAITLKQGRFRLQMDLYRELPDKNGSVRTLHTGHGETSLTSLVSDRLTGLINLKTAERSQLGVTEMIIRLVPIGGPPGLGGSSSRYLVASGRFLSGFSPKLLETSADHERFFDEIAFSKKSCESKALCGVLPGSDFCLNEKARSDFLSCGQNPGLTEQRPFEIRELTGIGWSLSNSDPALRTADYNIRACLTVPAEGDTPFRDIPVEVFLADGKKAQCFSDGDGKAYGGERGCKLNRSGCISFADQVQFQWYKKQRRLLRQARIVASNFSESTAYFVNPWDPRSGVDWSLRVPDLRFTKDLGNTNDDSRFVAASYSWRANSYDYSVDSLLNLSLHKQMTVNLDLSVEQNNSILDGARASLSLLPGWYAVRTLIKEPSNFSAHRPESSEWFNLKSQLVHYDGKAFNYPLSIEMADLRWMRARVELWTEVALVDPTQLSAQEKLSLELDNTRWEQVLLHGVGLEPQTFVASTSFLAEKDSAPVLTAQNFAGSEWNEIAKILPQLANIDLRQKKDILKRSQLSNLLSGWGVDFVSLRQEGWMLLADPQIGKQNKFYDPNPKILIQQLNQFAKISSTDLESAISSGIFSADLQLAFCHDLYWKRANDFYGKNPGFAAKVVLLTNAHSFCKDMLRNWSEAFKVEKKIVIREVDKQVSDKSAGYSLGVSVAADISAGHSVSIDDTLSTAVSAGLGGEFGIGNEDKPSILKADLGAKLDVSGTYSHGKTYSERMAEGSRLSAGTDLTVDVRPIGIHLKRYERCLSIMPNVEYQKKHSFWLRILQDGDRLKKARFERDLSRGLLLCDGLERKDKQITENYYFIAQNLQDSAINDRASLQNNPWLLSIRGRDNYLSFMQMLRANSFCSGKQNEHPNIAEISFDALTDSFDAYLHLPDIPGMVTETDPSSEIKSLPNCARTLNTWFKWWPF